MTVISVKCGDIIKINHIFGPFIDIVHKKQITPLDSWDETESEKCVLFSKFWILKIDLFWPFLTFLTSPWGQIWKLPLPLDPASKSTYITCVARLSCSFPHDDLIECLNHLVSAQLLQQIEASGAWVEKNHHREVQRRGQADQAVEKLGLDLNCSV